MHALNIDSTLFRSESQLKSLFIELMANNAFYSPLRMLNDERHVKVADFIWNAFTLRANCLNEK